MAFKRWGCEFEGPWPNPNILKHRKGIWVIWLRKGSQWEVVEVGESDNVRASFSKTGLLPHSRLSRLYHHPDASVHYSATYTPRLSVKARRQLARHIRMVTAH